MNQSEIRGLICFLAVRRSEPTWIFSVASGAFLTRESIGQGRLTHDGLAHSLYRACTIEAVSFIV